MVTRWSLVRKTLQQILEVHLKTRWAHIQSLYLSVLQSTLSGINRIKVNRKKKDNCIIQKYFYYESILSNLTNWPVSAGITAIIFVGLNPPLQCQIFTHRHTHTHTCVFAQNCEFHCV